MNESIRRLQEFEALRGLFRVIYKLTKMDRDLYTSLLYYVYCAYLDGKM